MNDMQMFLITILLLFILFNAYKYSNYIPVKAYDQNTYYMSSCKNCDIQLTESANTLAKINERILTLIQYLEKTNPDNNITKILIQNYSPKILRETIQETNYTSFTENKESISLCLRERYGNKQLYDINLLMYIVLHELAHFTNYNNFGFPILGHGQEFKDIFKFLIENAIKAKVYVYDDYRQNPQNYCGLTLNTTIHKV